MRRPNHKSQLANIRLNSIRLPNHRVLTEDTVLEAVRQTLHITVRVKVSGYTNFQSGVRKAQLRKRLNSLQRDDKGKWRTYSNKSKKFSTKIISTLFLFSPCNSENLLPKTQATLPSVKRNYYYELLLFIPGQLEVYQARCLRFLLLPWLLMIPASSPLLNGMHNMLRKLKSLVNKYQKHVGYALWNII